MTYVSPKWIRLVLPSYLLGGSVIGFFLPAMKAFATNYFGRSGFAVFFVINMAMPALVIVLAAVYPRLIVTIVGGLLATFAFLVTTGMKSPPVSLHWLADIVRQMGPIVTLATIGYLVLGALTVLVLRPIRRVGCARDPNACSCGYMLAGVLSDHCPECGNRRLA